MSSQIEKWNEREAKRKKLAEERKKQQKKEQTSTSQFEEKPETEPKRQTEQKQEKKSDKNVTPKPKRNKTNKGVKKMADTINWNDELKSDDTYKLAEKLGIDLSSFTADSEDSKKAQLDEIKKKIKEVENFPEGTTPTPEDKKLFDDIKKEGKTDEPQPKTERETLEVGGEEKPAPVNENTDWIKQKREFYEKFAHDQDLVLKNDPVKDTEEKSFTFSLEKDGKSLGEMKYTNPTSVQISKDAELVMYQGLIKDAIDNNLSISFGKSLDDKQKAMLLAAALTSEKKTYANGDGLELKDAPKIDVNAEYFKTLPQEVQTVLKEHVEKQAQQEAAQKEAEAKARQEAISKKLDAMRKKVEQRAQSLGKETKDLTTDEYRNAYREALHEGMTDEQKQARQEKIDDREKILAARLGLIPEHTTIGKDGKPQVIKEDAKTRELIEKVNPQRFQELQNKYSNQRS